MLEIPELEGLGEGRPVQRWAACLGLTTLRLGPCMLQLSAVWEPGLGDEDPPDWGAPAHGPVQEVADNPGGATTGREVSPAGLELTPHTPKPCPCGQSPTTASQDHAVFLTSALLCGSGKCLAYSVPGLLCLQD